METKGHYTERVGLISGIVTAAALIGYFLIMRAAGLADIIELRMFNFVILFAGIVWTAKRHGDLSGKEYNFFATLGNGFITAFIASAIFGLFMAVYLQIDTHMMAVLHSKAMFGDLLTPTTAAFTVFGEGVASGFIIAYICLFYMNNKRIQTTP